MISTIMCNFVINIKKASEKGRILKSFAVEKYIMKNEMVDCSSVYDV